MGYFAPWVFQDNVGQKWALGMNAGGQLTFTQLLPPLGNNSMLYVPLKDLVTGQVYRVSVVFTTIPTLTPTLSSGPTISPNYIPLTRPAVGTYLLQVSNGTLVANSLGDGPGVADPVVGELFNFDLANPPKNPPNLPNAGLPDQVNGGWLPNYSQPGGIGAQSFPAQQNGTPFSLEPSEAGLPTPSTGTPYEIGMGMNTAGCGHWFNNYEITFASVSGVQSAVVRCPLCGYLQTVITPASDLYVNPGLEHISS